MRITLTQVGSRLPVEVDPDIIVGLTRLAGNSEEAGSAQFDRTVIDTKNGVARWSVEEDLLRIREVERLTRGETTHEVDD